VVAGVTGWRVRRAVVGDAFELARINVAAWRSAYAGIMPEEFLAGMDSPDRVVRWRERIGTPDPYATFVALDEDDVFGGYCTVGVLRNEDGTTEPDVGELMAIYVDPARQGSGAGRAVHDAGLAHLNQLGFRRAGLWVFAANASARAFYAALGWAPDGSTHDDEIMGTLVPELRYARSLP
jgi:RimJ/RimL family protein N-acetyltransferase